MKKIVNGELVDLSPQEAAELEAYQAAASTPKQEDYAAAVQAHIDGAAKAREFNDGVTAATYLTSTVARWKADAEAFVTWRDQVWAYSYGELAKVMSGQRQQPSIADFINELPAIEWPADLALARG